MKRDVAALQSREFDLLVIGGGIFGGCVARDAVQRGLSVALVERGDFSGATSANSFKVVHGGFRYLQHLDLRRIRRSSDARRALLRIAPHLVHPLPIVVPTYGHGMKGKESFRAAMFLYDILAADRNAGIRDPSRQIPRGEFLSRDEVLDRYPGLDREGLTGAAVFCDGQTYNPPRLVLAFARTAAEGGGVIENYVEATRLLVEDDRVRGVQARDLLKEETMEIRSRVVLNATGPYAEQLLDLSLGCELTPSIPWSRDAYFVVPRRLFPDHRALALQTRSRDADAILSRGGRHLFLVPWRGNTLAGVWHKVHRGPPDDFRITEAELRRFVEEINGAYGGLDLTLEDVSLWNAGLIPFGENDPAFPELRFGHRSRLVDHARDHGVEGLVTLVGVRYTMAPLEAPRAVDAVFRKLGREPPPSRSLKTPLSGGDIDDIEALVEGTRRSSPKAIPTESIEPLVRNHGNLCERVLALTRDRPSLGSTIGSSSVLRAEVVHAVREEMAVRLEDVVLRRTDLGTAEYPGAEALEESLDLMATELEWGESRRQRELARVIESYPATIRAAKEPCR